ncbi:hypothetical protein MAR_026659 [Mya arenaria]|uniref:Uncharacterized protein n=1 Tax=Mya arenaria TaxID=6604 RepID=A0ABY7ETP5_MYAAR|nr:hypothetical protein MAR_026659 [Mya arenaria]
MIKFYCPTISDLGCGDCVVIGHRSCKVDYIADVSKDFTNGREFRELEPSIKREEDLISGCISKKELLGNIQKVKTDDESVLTELKTDCELAKNGLVTTRTELTSGDVPDNQRYVTARRAQKELREIHDKMEKMAGRMKVRRCRFFKDADTEGLLESKMGIGTLAVAGEFDEIDRLRKFRTEINTYLDRCEKELLGNIQKMKTDDESVLTELKTDCELVKSGLVATRTELTSVDVSDNQRYVTARRAQKELREIHDKMEKMAGRMKARKYRFVKDPDTEGLLGSKIGLGSLDVVEEFVYTSAEY